ncbi:MAG: hypothetical protein IT267_09715 [Saprospiraceae bacterium]|nr:hypothetical protein [Saprospiraceae bacterium]
MQNAKITFFVHILLCLFFFSANGQRYDINFVDIYTNQPYNNDYYDYIVMKRDQNRVKTKYFAENFASVESEFNTFKSSNKSIVCYAAAGYLTGKYNQVENLTIENGEILERNIPKDRFDALVIVYANGGVVVSDLRKGNLRLQGSGAPSHDLDIRNNTWHRNSFFEWCKAEKATVFQTHLLAHNGQFILPSNADTNSPNAGKRLRRFLIVGKDNNGKLKHLIINSRSDVFLRAGALQCYNFAKEVLGLNVSFMINLDTGAQNVFGVYNSNGTKFTGIKEDESSLPINKAHNLLVYYYE